MTKEEIEAVFAHVLSTWTHERKSQVAAYLRAIEKQGNDYWPLSDEEIDELVETDAAMERGEVASDEEVEAVFGRRFR